MILVIVPEGTCTCTPVLPAAVQAAVIKLDVGEKDIELHPAMLVVMPVE